MRKALILVLMIMFLSSSVVFACQSCGCAGGSAQVAGEAGTHGEAHSAKETTALCVKCGQIKGTEICCKQGQETCVKCGLVKGSPGCCKIPADAKGSVKLCGKCGEIKGTEKCCKPAI
ncbi:MAG: hypothetical protein GY853_14680 [PVC group bacterium]|nr:hypothetical protein [PVC group bacterium]